MSSVTPSTSVSSDDASSEPPGGDGDERAAEIRAMIEMGLPVSFRSRNNNHQHYRRRAGSGDKASLVTIPDEQSNDGSPPIERSVDVRRNGPDDHLLEPVNNDDLDGGIDDGNWTPVVGRKSRSYSNASGSSIELMDGFISNRRTPRNYVGGSKAPQKKYWNGRYFLFSKFDDGIKLDEESWYSVTPEEIALHIANRIVSQKPDLETIIDAMCGAGGNTIAFARSLNRNGSRPNVIAVDIDPIKIELNKHNSRIYGVDDRIEWITGDFLELAKTGKLKADVVCISPPWGGPKYLEQPVYKLSNIKPDIKETMTIIRTYITKNIALLVPRTTDADDLRELAGEGEFVETEMSFTSGRPKVITAYFGDLIDWTKMGADEAERKSETHHDDSEVNNNL